jgi:hypothetical protein
MLPAFTAGLHCGSVGILSFLVEVRLIVTFRHTCGVPRCMPSAVTQKRYVSTSCSATPEIAAADRGSSIPIGTVRPQPVDGYRMKPILIRIAARTRVEHNAAYERRVELVAKQSQALE